MSLFNKDSQQKQIVGVQISAEGVAFAHASPSPSSRSLQCCEFLHHATTPNPADALHSCVERLGLARQPCHLVLAPEDYQLLLVEAPPVPASELRDAVRWRIRDLIDFPVAEAVVDAFLVPEDRSRGAQRMAYAVVARRSVIIRCIKQVHDSKLALSAIDIPELVRRNLVETCCDTARGVAMVKLVQGGGSVQIVRAGELFLARQFALPYEGGLLEELPAEALVLELQRSFDYFERQMRQPPPAHIYLAGDNVTADKITDTIDAAFSASVGLLELAPSLLEDGQVPEHAHSHCLDVLGATLRIEPEVS